jgi:hypothetical protein
MMKRAPLHPIAGLLAVGLAFGANFAQAQAGSLDTTSGTGGIVTTHHRRQPRYLDRHRAVQWQHRGGGHGIGDD